MSTPSFTIASRLQNQITSIKMVDSAESYRKFSKPQYSHGAELLAKLNIESGQRVLDVGCGTGELSALLADKVAPHGRVLGIDPNEDRITLAKKRFNHVSNLTFVQAGICEIPRGDV